MRAFVLFFSLSDDDLFAAVKGPWRRKKKKKKNTTVSIEIKRFWKRKRKAAKHLCKQKSYSIIHVKALLNEKRKKKIKKKVLLFVLYARNVFPFVSESAFFLSFLSFSLFKQKKKLFALLLFSISSNEARRHAIQSACDEIKPTIEGSCNQGDKRKPSCALGFRFMASVTWRKQA